MGLRELRRIENVRQKQVRRRFVREKRRNLLAAPGGCDYVVILDHLRPDFNIGKIFRSADAFGARAVHLIGSEFFDPYPAKGSFKHVPAFFHSSFSDCYDTLTSEGYSFFVLEPHGDIPLPGLPLPPRSGFILGHEKLGVNIRKEDYPAIRSITIPQVGNVDCLNVSIAASIIMYEYLRQHSCKKNVSDLFG